MIRLDSPHANAPRGTPYTKRIATLAALAALMVAGCSRATAGPETTPYGGHFIAKIDNGVDFDLRFTPDGKHLTYKYLTGGQGEETVDPVIAKVGDQIYLITWFEPKTGFTVSHVENYIDHKIDLTWSYTKPDGTHALELHTATIDTAN
ncbi:MULTISPECIES: hypothetical protein [unclassified Nocardia]|uniref:MoaF-related domain-containing protein n=1 Tax=unclassified Nocardia TaxID=2637762 RepID=UPI001CE3D587|nr:MULTISPECIES: hypothetical protein [unclassified Nocardia]